jgi:hypothetical protein
MSMSLVIWKAPVVTDEDDARALVDREDDDPTVFEASADVLAFYDALLARYPPLESYPEDELRDTEAYWSVTPERSDRIVSLDLQWRVSDAMLDDIQSLAREHELVLYDPQGPVVHAPGAEDEPRRRDPAVVRQALFGTFVGVVGVALGLVVPIAVLDWLMIGVGAFLVVMGSLSVVVWLRE